MKLSHIYKGNLIKSSVNIKTFHNLYICIYYIIKRKGGCLCNQLPMKIIKE